MLYVLGGILGLLLLGFLYERIGGVLSARRSPPPGTLVDVGGHRLHVWSRGESGPTVVFAAGNGSPALIWERVAPAVATFARVVVYDRAGYGWSEPGPLPRTGERAAEELHTLLQQASIPGPYILVGHSLGGLHMRIFAQRFRAQVAGLVLVDATHEDELTERFPPEHIKGQRLLPKMMRMLAAMSQVGLVRLLAKLNMVGDIQKLAKRFPGETGHWLVQQAILPRALAAAHSEMATIEDAYALARSGRNLGDLPLVVLVHGQPGPVAPGTSPEVAQRIEQLLCDVAADTARYSTRGRLVRAANSGHEIQVYEPELVIEAIRTVAAQISEVR